VLLSRSGGSQRGIVFGFLCLFICMFVCNVTVFVTTATLRENGYSYCYGTDLGNGSTITPGGSTLQWSADEVCCDWLYL